MKKVIKLCTVLFFLGFQGANANLLINGDAENGDLTGWTVDESGASSGNIGIISAVKSQNQTAGTVRPFEGSWFFTFAKKPTGSIKGSGDTIYFYQTGTTGLDSLMLRLSGRVQTEKLGNIPDMGEVILSVVDADGFNLSSISSGNLLTNNLKWSYFEIRLDLSKIPDISKANHWRVDVFGTANYGWYANVFYDSLQLQADDLVKYNPANYHWYKRFELRMTWQKAKTYCEGLGGYLTTLTSQEENDVVYYNLCSDGTNYWLGGTDSLVEGRWEWISGEIWNYTNWGTGQPDNTLQGQDYLIFWNQEPNRWDDNGLPSHDEKFHFLCEWDDLDDFAKIIKKTDIDDDKDIDGSDLSIFLAAFGSGKGLPNYNPEADFNEDEYIDEIDLSTFNYMFGKMDTHLYLSGCKYLLKNEGISGEKLKSATDKKCYDFAISEPTTIAIISSGLLDLKGELFEIIDGKQVPIDANDDDIPDQGDRRINNEFTDRNDILHDNFMLRPGTEEDIRILPPGHYRIFVSFDDDATYVDDPYGLILLRRSQTQNERIENFFSGLRAIVEEDSGYHDNDYLDIYVRALFPDIYDTNWHNSIKYGGIIAERQCKALSNFFVNYIFEQGEFLHTDCDIDDNLSSNDPDWVLIGPGTTVYNNMSNPIFGDEDDAQRGDVWVKDMGLICLNGEWQSGFNHYGLYIDNSFIIDANWSDPTDGRLRISSPRSPTKIIRPF